MHLDSKALVVPVTIVLAFILLASTGWQAWRTWQQETDRSVATAMPDDASNPVKRQVPEVSLSGLGMFGAAETGNQNTQQSTENLPETNLKLILRGVLAAEGNFAGSALVEDDRNSTDAYLIGDTLPGNATLSSVHPRRIIIERSGKLENLYFPETDSVGGLTAVGSMEPADAAPSSPQPARSSATTPADNQRQAEIRERLEQLRQRLRDGN